MDDASRIEAFFRWFEGTVAGRAEPWRFGTALFDDEFPGKWDANFLRVERSLGVATAADLAAEADRIQAHLGHREITFPDDVEGARVAPGFVQMGWEADRLVCMALRREPDREGAPMEAGEATYDEVRALMVETGIRDIRGMTHEDAEMLADYDRVVGERIGARYFMTRVDGDPAGYCQLFERDGVAQVEDVNKLEEFRGVGAARAFMSAAIDAARAGGADLICLVADDADWPKKLYAKMGFDEVGYFRQFTKPPAAASSG